MNLTSFCVEPAGTKGRAKSMPWAFLDSLEIGLPLLTTNLDLGFPCLISYCQHALQTNSLARVRDLNHGLDVVVVRQLEQCGTLDKSIEGACVGITAGAG
ncbi:hypothetical protein WICPIJ_008100 [Wickerhamomyces pijperi]|uniref:Uncharacterized protein n=1 Tax=Wickerhamomyces pijperi TaxID=599730 RepID=A0A9P8Q094_WICPI|nr:hypothetical protein WICPIJ_008100 [Wickerhamomyces pijperi]